MRLHFHDQGRGPVLIILHGLFGSLENWAYISGQLSNDYRVVSVDQRNHGRSPHDPEMNYTVLARDLAEFIEEHRLHGACLMGHSMGGKTAMQFAATHSSMAGGLIVVDMAPRAYEPRHEDIFSALLSLNLEDFATRGEIESALQPSIPDMAVRRFLLKGLARTESGGWRWKFNLRALREHYSELSGPLAETVSFDGPSLFIRGAQSDYIKASDGDEIRKRFPRAELVTIEGASHWVHAEKPEEFLIVTRKFLRENF